LIFNNGVIPPAQWEVVQAEIKRRATIGPRKNNSPFTSKVRCGECGSWFGSKVWHSNTKYRRTVWQCNAKYTNGEKCQTPHVTESEVKAEFTIAVGKINREKLIAGYRKEQQRLRNTAIIETEIGKLEREIAAAWAAIQNNAPDALERLKRHDEAKVKQAELQRQKAERLDRVAELEAMVQILEGVKQAKYSEALWMAIVDYVEVATDGQMEIRLKY
jgi:hypothetical protein